MIINLHSGQSLVYYGDGSSPCPYPTDPIGGATLQQEYVTAGKTSR